MQEEKLVELLDGLMSTACDNCKKIEGVSQEKAEEICAGCPAGDHLCAILNEKQPVFPNCTLRRMRILP